MILTFTPYGTLTQTGKFIALLAAPFAIAFGAAFGILWKLSKQYLKGEQFTTGIVARVALVIFIGVLFITPIVQAHNIALYEVPSMNDGWHDSLTTIKADTEDGIITSWWDFGHWFVNIAERRVTFDGGNQGKRIYWVGKSLMTPDPVENKAILRMLNCGQNKGYENILKATEDKYESVELINTIIYETKEDARTRLDEAGLSMDEINTVLEKTHCSDDELLDQYYIASEDMVGKAGVWAHFGSWDFKKATMVNIAKNNEYETAIELMQNQLSIDEEIAAQNYYDITAMTDSRQIDSWISPWPSYVTTSAKSCVANNETITCTINQVLQRQQNTELIIHEAIITLNDPTQSYFAMQTRTNGIIQNMPDPIYPESISLENEDGEFIQYDSATPNIGLEIAVAQTNGNYRAVIADPILADSAFSRLFFFDGEGMAGYEKLSDIRTFNGQRIIVYKVDLTT